MFKTFSLFAFIAIASANEPTEEEKKEDTTPKMVPMAEADIAAACVADMTAICTTGGEGGEALDANMLNDAEDEDICEPDTDRIKTTCDGLAKDIAAGVAEGAEQGAKDTMATAVAGVT